MANIRTGTPRTRRLRGQSGVEFGLLVPILFLLLLGVGGLAPAFNADVALQNAAREGVRHGIWWNASTSTNPYANSTDLLQAVQDALQCSACVQLQPSSGQTCPVSYPIPGTAYPTSIGQIWMYACFNNDPAAATAAPGQPITILLTETLQTFAPLPGGGSTLKLQAAISMMTQST